LTSHPLDLESGRAGAVAEGGDAAVVAEPAAVEDHAGDAGGLGPLTDELAHRLGGVNGGRRAAALLEAEARVRPDVSSISWA
jgi:hypothetical protein